MTKTIKSITRLVSKDDMLNDKKYETWSRRARFLLIERVALDTIIEEWVQPMRQARQSLVDFRLEESAYKDTLNRDQLGRVVLLAHMCNDYMLKYEKYTIAKSVWDQVKEDFGGTTVTRLRQFQMNFDWFIKHPNVTMR